MQFSRRCPSVLNILLVLMILTSCGSPSGEESPLAITTGRDAEQFTFKPTQLRLIASVPSLVLFENQTPNQRHSWVIVRGGDDVARQVVDDASHTKEYLPVNTRFVVASSHMLNPGDLDPVKFTAPEAGRYTFICTFPGHFAAGMKGVVIVQ